MRPGKDYDRLSFVISVLSLWRSLGFAQYTAKPLRMALLVLSIALGVATLVGTQALGKGLASSRKNPLYQGFDLLVVGGRTGVPRQIATDIRAKPPLGVLTARALVIGNTRGEVRGNRRNIPLLGVDVYPNANEDSTTPLPGHMEPFSDPARLLALLRGSPCLVGADLAKDFEGGKVPITIEVSSGGQKLLLVPMGILHLDGVHSLFGGNLFLDAAVAGRFIYPERPDHATVVVVQSTGEAEKATGPLQTLVGQRGEVRAVIEEEKMVGEVTAAMELGFSLGGVGALVIGLFLVYNGLSVAVAERRHEIGVLRSTGATKSQIASMFLGEAALCGFIGSLLGIPMGWAIARVVEGPFGGALAEVLGRNMGEGSVMVGPGLIGFSLVAGTLTAMLAGLAPALSAANEPPADAVRRGPRTATVGGMFRLGVVSLVFMSAGVAIILLREVLPVRMGAFGGLVVFLFGGLVATPIFAFGISYLLAPVLRGTLGIEGRMAADNLIAEPSRTGLVVAALAATAALSLQTAGFIVSSETAVFNWVREKVGADLFLTSGSGFTQYIRSVSIREPLLAEIRKDLGDRLDTALGVRLVRFDYNKQVVYMIAVDTQGFAESKRVERLEFAKTLKRFPRLSDPGTALVSENFAILHKVKVGDRIELASSTGPVSLEILGTVVDYTWSRGVILTNRQWYKERFKDPEIDIIDLFLAHPEKPGESDAIKQILETQFAKREGLFVIDQATLLEEVGKNLRSVYNLAYAQQGILGLVALLGVVSALFVSVLQRRRELGLLRAVGAKRKQIFTTVLVEGFLMGVAGAFAGIVLGLALYWYAVELLMGEEAGMSFPLVVPWSMVGLVLISGPLVATLAAIAPAVWATKIGLADALAYE